MEKNFKLGEKVRLHSPTSDFIGKIVGTHITKNGIKIYYVFHKLFGRMPYMSEDIYKI